MTTLGRYAHSWLEPGRKRKLVIAIVAIAILLLALRIALPSMVQNYVNKKLDESPEYAGEVGDIDIALIVGAYSIENVEVIKTEADVPVPLFTAREVQFSLLWKALFHGAVVGEAELYEPVINIVDSKDQEKEQDGDLEKFVDVADDLFPLLIDQVQIHDGQLHFQNFDNEPPVDIYLADIQGVARNLSNSEALTTSPIAHVEITALAMNDSDLAVNAAVDTSREQATFDLNLKLLSLPMSHLDNFIRTYAPFDIEAGKIDIVTELAARDGVLEGYVKPIIYNLEVFKWSEDIEEDHDNPFKALWEGLVGAIAELLENQPRDQLATNIPLEGDLNNPDTSVIVTIAGILRNAFVEALQANLDNSISLFDEEEEMPAPLPEPLEPLPETSDQSSESDDASGSR
jgi:hypothetical protein